MLNIRKLGLSPNDSYKVTLYMRQYQKQGYLTNAQQNWLDLYAPSVLKYLEEPQQTPAIEPQPQESRTMNLANALLSENENFKYVSVVFPPYTGSKEYTYKTLLDVCESDFCIVSTPNSSYQVVQVRSIVDDLSALDVSIKYKWLVQKVCFDAYNHCVEVEKTLEHKLQTSKLRKQREQLKNEALEFLTDEERTETIKLARL